MSIDFNSFVLKKILGNNTNQSALTGTDAQQYQNVSAFESASLDDLESIDLDKLLNSDDALDALDENATEDQQALAEMIKALMDIDEVQQAVDTDNSGDISSDELEAFLKDAMAYDGDMTTLTMDDLNQLVNTMNIDLNSVLEDSLNKIDETQETQATQETSTTPKTNTSSSSSGASGANGSSYNSSNTSSSTSTPVTAEEIQQEIADKETEISNVQAEGEAQIQEQEEAKKAAMENQGVSEEEYQAYQEQEQNLETQITDLDNDINNNKNTISTNEATIQSNSSYIESLDSQISANQSALNNISDDSENAESQKSDLNAKISNLESEKEKIEQENEKLQKENEEIQNKITEEESQKAELETQKQELLNNTLNSSEGFAQNIKDSSSVSAIKDSIAQYDQNIAQIRQETQEKVDTLRGEIQELQVQLKDVQEKESRQQMLKDNSFLEGSSVLDMASEFEGKTQEEMKQIMKDAGYQFDEGFWCADFVSFIAGSTLGEENLPDWYTNTNRASCQSVYDAAANAGALVDASEVQPGDLVIFDWNGDGHAQHIGYVVAVNDDGSITTVEGNTSGNASSSQVSQKTRQTSSIKGYARLVES